MNATNLKKLKIGFVKTNDREQAGLACLASVVKFYGGTVEMQRLYNNSGAAENGVNLLGLCKAAQWEGFKANGFKANVDALKGLDNPTILHVSKESGSEDFIVLYGWHKNKFIVGDPQWGIVEYREDELEVLWKSKALVVMEPDESFKLKSEKTRLKREWFLNLLDNHKRVLTVLAVLGLVSSVILIAFLPMGIEIAEGILNSYSSQQFFIDAAFLFIPLLLFIAVSHFKNIFIALGAKSLNLELNRRIIESSFINQKNPEQSSGGNIDYLAKVADRLCNFVFKLTSGGPFFVLLFLVSLIYIAKISIWAGLAIILTVAVFIVVIWFGRKKMEQLYASENEYLKQKAEVLNYSFGTLQNIKLINGKESFTSKAIDNLGLFLEAKATLERAKNQIGNWLFFGLVLITFFIAGVVLFFAENIIQVSWLSLFGWLIISFFSIYGIKNLLIDFIGAKISFNLIYSGIGIKKPRKKKEVLKDKSSKIFPVKKLVIENLGFAFPGQTSAFHNFNLTTQIGDITVVNARVGSGKSVMVSVLNRLLPMQEGEITINDSNWMEIKDFEWRENTSTVLQPVQLFGDTLFKNIAGSEDSFERKEIISFCKKLKFDEFFKEFPNAYSTIANQMSSGQKQLVALAAALYRNPRLLLLDEPFVFMDDEMMNFSLELLHKLKNEMMIIIFTGSNKIKSKDDNFFVYKMMNYIYD